MSTLKISLRRLKQEAKSLNKESGIGHRKALEEVARQHGFSNWEAVRQAEPEFLAQRRPALKSSNKYFQNKDSRSTAENAPLKQGEDLPAHLKIKLTKNQTFFVSLGIQFSIFEPTDTGLRKSILDATIPVRAYFESESFHFYTQQGQGEKHKVKKSAFFITPEATIKTTVSLYRPTTKNGDPRMWFPKLRSFANADDQIAIVAFNDSLYLFNFSHLDSSEISGHDQVGSFIDAYLKSKGSIAEELLAKLKLLAKNPIPATVDADTAIGRAIETALGIKINSSKKPDYKGIELKSGRVRSKVRSGLFNQVAEWSISPCNSSAAILDKYGYQRGEDFKLNCTVSTQRPNSQGLQLFYDIKNDQLIEQHENGDIVAIWPGHILRARLLEKHAETFWISAKSIDINGVEHFQLTSVIHTKKPVQAQLLPLIAAGVITMDHQIKRSTSTSGKTKLSERGPSFKIVKRDLELLFPAPATYSLLE